MVWLWRYRQRDFLDISDWARSHLRVHHWVPCSLPCQAWTLGSLAHPPGSKPFLLSVFIMVFFCRHSFNLGRAFIRMKYSSEDLASVCQSEAFDDHYFLSIDLPRPMVPTHILLMFPVTYTFCPMEQLWSRRVMMHKKLLPWHAEVSLSWVHIFLPVIHSTIDHMFYSVPKPCYLTLAINLLVPEPHAPWSKSSVPLTYCFTSLLTSLISVPRKFYTILVTTILSTLFLL